MSIKCTVVIQQEGDWYVATCLENQVSSQGRGIEEAAENLREAISLYYEDNQSYPPSSPVFITTMEIAV